MQDTDRVAAIFSDAWTLYADAVEILEAGKQRIAAEAAWGATKRATDALILARTGREPAGMGQSTRWLANLGRGNRKVAPLVRRYNRRIVNLHWRCFYSGIRNEVCDLIRETADYIRDAERLAGLETDVKN